MSHQILRLLNNEVSVEDNKYDDLSVCMLTIGLTNYGSSFAYTCCDDAGSVDVLMNDGFVEKLTSHDGGFGYTTSK